MSLSLYKKKRSFDKTPEPSGKEGMHTSKALRFVVQKHDATRLHYDFRLEMEGVLKSWAVPKGPSLNPEDKRLAMMVEDHPYDYRSFEGTIPEGNYGAGTVIVWDEGTYEPAEEISGTFKQQEKLLLEQLKTGNLRIRLNGTKLKGDYALVHTKGREENAWLLIKKKDEFSSTDDITKEDKSVQSGKTLEEVASSDDKGKKSVTKKSSKLKPKKPASASQPEKKKSSAPAKKKVQPEQKSDLLKKGKRAAYDTALKPMLASLTEEAFDSEDWLFEIKWDGYRAIAGIRNGKVELQSRNNLSFNKKYYPVTKALENWAVNAIVDGEIIALTESGVTDFQHLQAWQKTGKGDLVYYVFDLLWLEGLSILHLPLIERKEILKSIIPADSIIKFSDHIPNTGKDFFEVAVKEGLEGIMAKKADSQYHPGVRTQQWLKIKTHRRQEVVIGGFTKPRNSRQYLGALILGVYENNELVYIGHTGSGFNQKSLAEMYKKLQPLITETCPFKKRPKTNMPAVWVKPQLVAEVKFQEWTNENILRIPIFIGLREDKNPKDVKKEQSDNTLSGVVAKNDLVATIDSDKKLACKKSSPVPSKSTKKVKKVDTETQAHDLLDKGEKDQTITLDKQHLKFTNLDKLYWKKERISKRDLLNYYHRIAPFILPYLHNRPQSLNRHPDGADGMNFYQKDVTGKVPEWIQTYGYISESDGEKKEFLVCTNEASLLYMANWGCIEMNPWHSRITSADNPDYCVIDLDPEKISFDKVIETAKVVKKVLDELEIDSYCKTSGATGLHIYIPLGAKYNYDQSRQLAELIVQFVHDEIPDFTSLERSPKKRQNKVYLDYLQNRTIQTLAAPYSVRPKKGATVSAPLHWEELKKGLSPSDFNMLNIFERIKSEGDLFQPVLQKGIDLNRTLKKINAMIAKGTG